jgi:hypothetical protein
MKTIMRYTVCLAMAIAVSLGALSPFVGIAHAQYYITVSHSAGPGGVHAYNVPDGSGFTLIPEIVINMRSVLGPPIVGYPAHAFSLTTLDGSIVFCPNVAVADHDTDGTGTTTISGPLAGGGFSGPGGFVYVSVDGIPQTAYPLSLWLNSSDITGDLRTDLLDFAVFGGDFGGTAFRSDFTWDGVVDLIDFSMFGTAYFSTCP